MHVFSLVFFCAGGGCKTRAPDWGRVAAIGAPYWRPTRTLIQPPPTMSTKRGYVNFPYDDFKFGRDPRNNNPVHYVVPSRVEELETHCQGLCNSIYALEDEVEKVDKERRNVVILLEETEQEMKRLRTHVRTSEQEYQRMQHFAVLCVLLWLGYHYVTYCLGRKMNV